MRRQEVMVTRQFIKSVITLFILLSMLVINIAYAKPIYITQLRVIRKPHHWQFVFDATADLHCKTRYLSNPDRIIASCPGLHLKQMIHPATYVTTPVTKIHARRQQNTLYLTFDLDHSVSIHSFALPAMKKYGPRFVIDLRGKQMKIVGFNIYPSPHVIAKPQPLKLQPLITPTSELAAHQRDVVVVIDPGHGGKDPGATGVHGTHEKDVVLAIAKDLQRDINKVPGFKAVLTRHGDYFISLRGRLAIARKYKADMFVAIHADAYRDATAQGVSVFALSQRGATSEAAHWLAARENKSELMGGVDLYDKSHMLRSVLINLSQIATIRTSLHIGEDLVQNIGRYAELHHGHRVEQAAFVVLKSPDIPSLLVETGFISNRFEERRLISPQYQNRLAQSIADGVCEYFENRPPRGSALALRHHHSTSS